MEADKIMLEVVLDRETNYRIKGKLGYEVRNGENLMRAIVSILNMHDTQIDNIRALREAYESERQKNNNEVKEQPDNVNHPKHYQGKHECIDEMIAMFGVEAVKGFCKCNVYKYRYRADKKNGDEDLKKGEWYMDYLMKLEERGND